MQKYIVILILILSNIFMYANSVDRATETTTFNQADQPISNVEKTDWTFLVHISAQNGLHYFTFNNIEQMISIGSNKHINIVVQLDQWGTSKTFRYFIEKNNARLVDSYVTNRTNTSGTSENLYKSAQWALTHYPCKHFALIMWNHGSGILDPAIWGKSLPVSRDALYIFNPETSLLEVNQEQWLKGISFNDFFETYITNKEFTQTLKKISTKLLNDKKIDVLGMDACHMAMIEIATQMKSCVNFLVASQETEPGPGWNYNSILQPFQTKSLTPAELSAHIVFSYQKEYTSMINDYTQSALDLSLVHLLEDNISTLATKLTQLLSSKHASTVGKLLSYIRTSESHITYFYNHSYIDLCHFYQSVLKELSEFELDSDEEQFLKKILQDGIDSMHRIAIANVAGPALPNAHGISIYFPIKAVHSSYFKTFFAQNTSWLIFLKELIKKAGRTSHDTLDYSHVSNEFTLIPSHDEHGNIIRKKNETINKERNHVVSTLSQESTQRDEIHSG